MKMENKLDGEILYEGTGSYSYTKWQERVDSFLDRNCPIKLSQLKEKLANGGFYYRTTVNCYACRFSLKWAEDMNIDEMIFGHEISSCVYIKSQQEELLSTINKSNGGDKQQTMDLQSNGSTDHHLQVPPDIEKLGVPCTEASGKDEGSTCEDYDELVAENQKLRDQLYCTVCRENKKEILFIPCNDFFICSKCYKPGKNRCPKCLNNVESIVNVMFS